MKITQYPPNVFPAYNPVLVHGEIDDDEPEAALRISFTDPLAFRVQEAIATPVLPAAISSAFDTVSSSSAWSRENVLTWSRESALVTSYAASLSSPADAPSASDTTSTASTSGKSSTVKRPIELRRSYFGNAAVFNISDVIKKSFTSESNTSSLLCDELLAVKIWLTGIYTGDKIKVIKGGSVAVKDQYVQASKLSSPYYLALNAVEQIGKSCDYTKQAGTIRSCFDKLIQYAGYPRTVTILGFGNNTHFSFSGNEQKQAHSGYSLFSKILPDNSKEIRVSQNKEITFLGNGEGNRIVTEDGDNIIIFLEEEVDDRSLAIENRCLPENPFYIRWINQLAGWDYWMFSFRQIKESKMLNQQTYSPSVFNTESAYTFTEEFYKEAEELITVGAEGLEPKEFEGLRKIPYSPRVEMYDKETARWYRLIPEESGVGEDTHDSTKTIELTFRLPEPQIQV